MKQADVIVGGEYRTRVAGALLRVRVVEVHTSTENNRARVRYVVQRVDSVAPLPKLRSAAALRAVE